MTKQLIALLTTTFAVALVPGLALAKGASEAVIIGPGLDRPIAMPGEGQVGGEELMRLAESAGFFPVVFGQTPDVTMAERPEGTLGPRYTITYEMPGPNNELDRLRQDLYPYATPNPVTYMAPGQPFFTTEHTRGGWYVATSQLKDELVAAGLPDSAPTGTGDGGFPWAALGAFAAALVLVVAAVAAIHLRRRERPVRGASAAS